MENNVKKNYEWISAEFNNAGMSAAEKLSIAVQMERNQILKKAFALSDLDKYPTALEAIAIALGYKQ